MWIDPSDPNSFAGMGQGVKACGMTPFCSPMKPCCLTPLCGRTSMTPMNAQTLMLGNNGMVYPSMPGQPMSPTPLETPQGSPPPGQKEKKPPTVAGPNGMLVSMGIVPGMSPITTGGVVAAAGVATPVGLMTPMGVQLPNGTLNNQVVIKACVLHPGCNAARPCGMSPGCGSVVPLAMVAAQPGMMPASALSAPGVAGGVMQAGPLPGYVNGAVMHAGGMPAGRMGTGMLVNPITGMPVSGLSMTGGPQTGYPPIGYTPTGYNPRYPRYDGLGFGAAQSEEEDEEETVETGEVQTPSVMKSQMPVPRFHPVPSKPAFQRSEGLPVAPGTNRNVSSRSLSQFGEIANSSGKYFSEESINGALERAYLEGMSAAMDEVGEELDAQNQERSKAEMRAEVLNKAKNLQTKLDARSQRTRSQDGDEDQIDEAPRSNRRDERLRIHEEETLAKLERIEQLERQAKIRARRLAEQQALEEDALRQAQIRQARFQQDQFQRAQIQQAQLLQNDSNRGVQYGRQVQPVGFQPQASGTEKGFLASTFDFLKGSDQRPAPPNRSQQQGFGGYPVNRQTMQQPVQASMQPSANANFLASARAFGNDLASPVSELLEPNSRKQTQYAVRPKSPMQYQGRPAYSNQAAMPRLCPPYPVEPRQNPVARRPNVEANRETVDMQAYDKPSRPPTAPRKFRKIIEVDDLEYDEENNALVQQAHFIDSN